MIGFDSSVAAKSVLKFIWKELWEDNNMAAADMGTETNDELHESEILYSIRFVSWFIFFHPMSMLFTLLFTGTQDSVNFDILVV